MSLPVVRAQVFLSEAQFAALFYIRRGASTSRFECARSTAIFQTRPRDCRSTRARISIHLHSTPCPLANTPCVLCFSSARSHDVHHTLRAHRQRGVGLVLFESTKPEHLLLSPEMLASLFLSTAHSTSTSAAAARVALAAGAHDRRRPVRAAVARHVRVCRVMHVSFVCCLHVLRHLPARRAPPRSPRRQSHVARFLSFYRNLPRSQNRNGVHSLLPLLLPSDWNGGRNGARRKANSGTGPVAIPAVLLCVTH